MCFCSNDYNLIDDPRYTSQRNAYENKTNNFLLPNQFAKLEVVKKCNANNQYRKYAPKGITHGDVDKKRIISYRNKSNSPCLTPLSAKYKNASSKNSYYASKSNRQDSIQRESTLSITSSASTFMKVPSSSASAVITTTTKVKGIPEKVNINEISSFRYQNAVDCISKLNQPLLLLSLNCGNVNKFNERLLCIYPHQHYYYYPHHHHHHRHLSSL